MTLVWQEVSTRLRPFVRRRVDSDADADDVMQNVLLKAHRSVDALENVERIDAWLYRVARTAIADHYRDRQRHPMARSNAPESSHEPFQPPDDAAAEELSNCVALFTTMLPSPYREAITLTELEGRTQREAAEMLGISLSGMKSRVQRGRAKLRGLLEQCCAIEVDVRGRVVGYERREMGCGSS
ncbi:MAG: RNA polymerase sigma factor SigZ [Sandaracinaceae bacterium]